MILLQKLVSHYWAVNLHVIKILRIEREGMIHDVISHDQKTSFVPRMLVDSDQRL